MTTRESNTHTILAVAAALKITPRQLKVALAQGLLPKPDRQVTPTVALAGFSDQWLEAAREVPSVTLKGAKYPPQRRDPQPERLQPKRDVPVVPGVHGDTKREEGVENGETDDADRTEP